mmetsp:Transcript_36090/g.81120  ORF Transcript_36090/g.81120 Transcript_36090/m.81120 type:complete len:208 (-) Transcript_36090:1249-1872(-)
MRGKRGALRGSCWLQLRQAAWKLKPCKAPPGPFSSGLGSRLIKASSSLRSCSIRSARTSSTFFSPWASTAASASLDREWKSSSWALTSATASVSALVPSVCSVEVETSITIASCSAILFSSWSVLAWSSNSLARPTSAVKSMSLCASCAISRLLDSDSAAVSLEVFSSDFSSATSRSSWVAGPSSKGTFSSASGALPTSRISRANSV